ncbi:DNA cytosine methyltransferase [Mucilaginibacter ximonensis]|uniref:DNA (cytosine-5-)-methyltransferase n=1 Tax=Mucilaginibacter ximonensis TaxID=538021 RepID=A0ABW5YFL8_9SPHI
MRINHNQYNLNLDQPKPASDKITLGVFFAGGGGISHGAKKVKDIELRWILNHDATAIKTSAFHNKGVKAYWADVYVQDELEMEPVDIVQASLECDQHTGANAGKEKEIGSYTMGWEFYRYLKHLNPMLISIENVPEFKKWAPLDEHNQPIKARQGEEFERWKKAIMDLGYDYIESIRNAADDGLPTRRVRYFCYFYRPGMNISFPEYTHSETGEDGKLKWLACRPHIDTDDHGVSIFGRKYNKSLKKIQQQPLCANSIRRIIGGIKKQCPETFAALAGINQFLCKYHAGENPERSQSLDKPIAVIDGSNRHQLVTVEKLQFIMDHCHSDNYHSLLEPIKPILTRQTKQFATIDTTFITQYYGGGIQSNTLDEPIYTIPCRDTHQLVRLEKAQFIAKYFNSSGNPEYNTQSLDEPISAILEINKHQLVTILDDFDIKVRFLRPDELAGCSTFPRDYFSHPELKLSHKAAVGLIGNAVPPYWTEKKLKHNIKAIKEFKNGLAAA